MKSKQKGKFAAVLKLAADKGARAQLGPLKGIASNTDTLLLLRMHVGMYVCMYVCGKIT